MPSVSIVREVAVTKTPRVMQVEGMFDVPPSERSREAWEVNLPIDDRPWNIGLIVGPSGCGKSTIARELFGDAVCAGYEWSHDKAILDGFPAGESIKDITELLSHVGFSSPPLWLRPYRVLSTGQQMRVNIARLLAEERGGLAVMDEFTSVVDRTVAQIGSAAVAKTVRRRGQKFIAVTCHHDVQEWLQPDWVYQPHVNEFLWKRPSRRPPIELEISRVHYSAWRLFRQYHYLDTSFNKSARAFVAFLRDGTPVALQAVIASPHPKYRNLYRGHRAVCMPDYQGVGIGNALITYVASAYRGLGNRILSTTASPALMASRSHDQRWKLLRNASRASSQGKNSQTKKTGWVVSVNRLTTTWEYVGPKMAPDEARRLIYG